ncbi:hypothetical protein [Cupriavidus pauculus]|uniref:Uncharacterized protein n=1 Tax=Cupriavidus pauculus TaxID=82633 RepID=A0A2N5C6W7_9BURK|nr:hypothetical protein [Cupriavidus pauculus]PLP97964.1 hypothetical protein CYJ10_24590 [Cupriavidus pauculus]
MQRLVRIGEFEVSIQARLNDNSDHPGYVVSYSIVRSDGSPVRDNLPKVQSNDLIDGTEFFSDLELAMQYAEDKARDNVQTLVQT